MYAVAGAERGLNATVVLWIELGVLLIGNFRNAHPKRSFDANSLERSLVVFPVQTAHDELTGGDEHHVQDHTVAQIDRLPPGSSRSLLPAAGFPGIKRPTGGREGLWRLGRGRGWVRNQRLAGNRHGGRGVARGRARVGNSFGVVIDVPVQLEQFATAVALDPGISHVFTPGTVIRAVQVDPGNQPVPGLGVQLHLVVSLRKHLDQLRGIGVELHGLEQVVIAFDSRTSDVAVQFGVADRELAPHGRGAVDLVVRDHLGAPQVGDQGSVRRGRPSWQPMQCRSMTG